MKIGTILEQIDLGSMVCVNPTGIRTEIKQRMMLSFDKKQSIARKIGFWPSRRNNFHLPSKTALDATTAHSVLPVKRFPELAAKYRLSRTPHDGEDKTVDVVVDIFNRVNSGGTKLSKGDLALAKICANGLMREQR